MRQMQSGQLMEPGVVAGVAPDEKTVKMAQRIGTGQWNFRGQLIEELRRGKANLEKQLNEAHQRFAVEREEMKQRLEQQKLDCDETVRWRRELCDCQIAQIHELYKFRLQVRDEKLERVEKELEATRSVNMPKYSPSYY